MKKILFGVLGLLIIIPVGFIIFIYSSYDKRYDSAFPVPDLKVESDSSKIARGRYLAQGPAHCIDCHSPRSLVLESGPDEELPMTGGFGLEIPPGKYFAPNLTPDKETGIGRYSDGELYRVLRHNILPDGRSTIDIMPFINMSDEDIYDIIAYLRSQKPIKNKNPESELTFLGKMLTAMEAIKPGVPDEPLLKGIEPDTTIEYGRYLSYAVANCRGCHTERDLNSGEFIGENYAGGMTFGPDALTKDWVFVAPNLTPDMQTGIMADWEEDDFVNRLKGGRLYDTSPMPWEAYEKMSENDLKAIYRYLRSLNPVSNSIDPIVLEPEEDF
jgi:mono/diheme cytochrome c family protein